MRSLLAAVVLVVVVVAGCGDDEPSCSEVEAAVDDYIDGETTRDEFMDSIGAGSDTDAEAVLQRCG